MSLEISGKVYAVLPEQGGQGRNGPWVKQEFVIETEDQFPKKVCFSVWGEKVSEIKPLNQGDKITVSFNVESREFNNKWYTDLRAWKIAKSGAGAAGPLSEELPPITEKDIPLDEAGDDLPF
jgi:hypothetical protein